MQPKIELLDAVIYPSRVGVPIAPKGKEVRRFNVHYD
jgi:hypothetical protein